MKVKKFESKKILGAAYFLGVVTKIDFLVALLIKQKTPKGSRDSYE